MPCHQNVHVTSTNLRDGAFVDKRNAIYALGTFSICGGGAHFEMNSGFRKRGGTPPPPPH